MNLDYLRLAHTRSVREILPSQLGELTEQDKGLLWSLKAGGGGLDYAHNFGLVPTGTPAR